MAGNGPLAKGTGAPERFHQGAVLLMLASAWGALAGAGDLFRDAQDLLALAAAGAALLWRAASTAGLARIPAAGAWSTWTTAAYVFYYPADYLWISRDFLKATIHLVFFIFVIKLLTARSARDFLLLKVIAFLGILAASLVSFSSTYFLFLCLFLASAISAMASEEILRAQAGRKLAASAAARLPWRLAKLTAASTLAVLLLTAALFFFLPRTARAAFEHLLKPHSRASGFSSEVMLGQVGEIRRQTATVFHARFLDRRLPALKWRATALGEFDGWRWYSSLANEGRVLKPDQGLVKLLNDDQLRHPARRFTYEVLLDNSAADWLFLAGQPEYLRVNTPLVLASSASGYRVPLLGEGFRYVVHAALPEAGHAAPLDPAERNYYLRLPVVDERILELARKITAGARSDAERAARIESWLLSNFRYSTRALEHEVDDPLAHFLFEGRKGHCEYFASAMAVLLRAVWVPARVAVGYREGSFNSLTGWHVIRASDAHSWVEAWIEGRGWVEYDPTPPDPEFRASGLWERLNLWSDAIGVFWQEWVLGYDLDRQLALAVQVGESRRRFAFSGWLRWWDRIRSSGAREAPQPMIWVALAAAAAAGLLGYRFRNALLRRWQLAAGRRKLRLGAATPHDAALIYERMLLRLRRLGFEKPPWMTPLEFAACLPEGELAAAVRRFTLLYQEFRFGRNTGSAAELAECIDRIEALPARR
ncbi:MAG: DUF3488 and transglutaminase-like domain-containing protein [Bryobacteraceae bacterium]